MEGKYRKPKGVIITLIIIIILLLGVIGYFVYDKYYEDNNTSNSTTECITNEEESSTVDEDDLLTVGCKAFETYLIDHMANWIVNDYKINSCTLLGENELNIMGESNTTDKFYLGVSYDLKPINITTYQPVGNGEIENNWHVGNSRFITVQRINNIYAVTETATGL